MRLQAIMCSGHALRCFLWLVNAVLLVPSLMQLDACMLQRRSRTWTNAGYWPMSEMADAVLGLVVLELTLTQCSGWCQLEADLNTWCVVVCEDAS